MSHVTAAGAQTAAAARAGPAPSLWQDPTVIIDRDATHRTGVVEADLAHVWHPFTQHGHWPDEPPLVIDRGQGVWLFDDAGRRYLDGTSSLWVLTHGHREPAIDDAVRRQLDRVAHSTFLGLTHGPGVELAERLVAVAPPGLSRVFYAGDGSSAVEAALKISFQAAAQRGEHRPLYVHVEHGYHGDTLGAVSVGGIDTFFATFRPILLETRQAASPGTPTPGQALAERAAVAVADIERVLEAEGERTAAVVVEPIVQAAGGILVHDPAYLRGVRAACDRHGALMLVDEVATGVGRTGTMWAVEQAGVSPDLLVCGKGLTGGYLPLAAVLATEEVYEAFLGRHEDLRTFFHGHTYTANPLACAAAIANLDLMAERDTVGHARQVGSWIGDALHRLDGRKGVAGVRRAGTMTGIALTKADGAPLEPALRAGWQVSRRARDHGVLIRALGDVVVLMPPLAITYDDLMLLTDVVIASVEAVLDGLLP
ncbi:MAG TPA: adenosylmethionine--8-amino-7-oxononanoate transaminase [Mycobacteriales bacterium]|nr:adenosylmethionine--8-amino-7-oxononanoate transaminase [Mycobacteriales bacterium]